MYLIFNHKQILQVTFLSFKQFSRQTHFFKSLAVNIFNTHKFAIRLILNSFDFIILITNDSKFRTYIK